MNSALITTNELSRRLNRHPATIRKELTALNIRTIAVGKRRYYRRGEVLALLRENGVTV